MVGSTVLIVIFSEILPQAICSRHGLAVGAFFAIPVRLLMLIWFIIAWPVAKLLDLLLGKHQGFMYGVSGKTDCKCATSARGVVLVK